MGEGGGTSDLGGPTPRTFSGRPGLQLVIVSFISSAFFVSGVVLTIFAVADQPVRPNVYVAVSLLLCGIALLATLLVSVTRPGKRR